MKLFPLHIIIKDLSFLMLYFLIMKFNLTNETFLPETTKYFSGVSQANIVDMLMAALFYNFIPIIISCILYYPIVLLGRKIFNRKNNLQVLSTAFLLSITTPIIYIFGYKMELDTMNKAEIISWILTFVISVSIYYLSNRIIYQNY
ncbi:hypothetical protein [Chryseobacterium turcicum]|uniref:Uncharacterized protein n=1 Tax=Chryseobacterium turcicum TaxID=2898076 RepID=A0A9Q3UZ98_9FLAO|nr:hypothetical protein [Chryseobacterium turcicum]MCD1115277.1 hypothetical protein [Chryseobacterium turcicum]